MSKRYLKWEDVDFTWDDLNMIWDDVAILTELDNTIRNSGGYSSYYNNNPWKQVNKDLGVLKTKRIIKLYCEYKGIEYSDSIIVNEDIIVKADEFELFVTNSIRDNIKIKVDF